MTSLFVVLATTGTLFSAIWAIFKVTDLKWGHDFDDAYWEEVTKDWDFDDSDD